MNTEEFTSELYDRHLINYLISIYSICRSAQRIQLAGSPFLFGQNIYLEQVYIDLDVEQIVLSDFDDAVSQNNEISVYFSRRPLLRRLSVIEAIKGTPDSHIILLGIPGSGKTIFLNHLALCLAGAALAKHGISGVPADIASLKALPNWDAGILLPIYVDVVRFAAFIVNNGLKTGSIATILQFIEEDLKLEEESTEMLKSHLDNTKSILLLDGIDRINNNNVFVVLKDCVMDIKNKHLNVKILITCRFHDYKTNRNIIMPGFTVHTIAPLNEEQKALMIKKWYNALKFDKHILAFTYNDLVYNIGKDDDFKNLTQTPLLLSNIIINTIDLKPFSILPQVCERLIKLLLIFWRDEEEILYIFGKYELPNFVRNNLFHFLSRIGYEIQEKQAQKPRIHQNELRSILQNELELYVDNDYILRDHIINIIIINIILLRNELMIRIIDDNVEYYSFPQKSFQEYLSGYYLNRQRNKRNLCIERAASSYWHGALSSMVHSQILVGEIEQPLDLAAALIKRSLIEQLFAGDILILIGYERAKTIAPELAVGLWANACRTLYRIFNSRKISQISLRVRAGFIVGMLCYGEPSLLLSREDIIPLSDQRLPCSVIGSSATRELWWNKALQEYWCVIQAGSFWYGDELHQEQLLEQFSYTFKIARYPITNAEFARFILAEGYDIQQPWWSRVGREIAINNTYEPRYWRDSLFNNPLQPIVGISWYEADAYTRWLTIQGHNEGWLPLTDEIRLPTSLEWERAARHIDKRRYPWGKSRLDNQRANYSETGIERPSPVGIFPAGAAKCKALDLVGNIWEWTASLSDYPDNPHPTVAPEFPDTVITRGGSWFSDSESLGCGVREWSDPETRFNDLGFRIVWVTGART